MITVHSGRERPSDRVATKTDKTPAEATATFPAPVRGWMTNQSPAAMDVQTAWVLDNFWPEADGVTVRGGYKSRVDTAGDVTALFEYAAGDLFIAMDATAIYTFDANTADGTTLSAVVSSQTSGDWHGAETQNDAGSFFTAVNGSDDLQLYDGSSWQAVNSGSSPHSITGTGLSGTDALSFVWNYRERVWFVEAGTMNAWYLGVNSVSGTATKFPIAGIFNKGGSLHSGATFSSDSGAGMDDRILFMTTEGEFAIYEGDPADSLFTLIGVYDIGKPLGRNPFIQVGGDVLIATELGLIPASAAIQKDPSQLKAAAVSAPIAGEWRYWQTYQPDGWTVAKWDTRNMALIGVPSDEEPFVFALNLETGAWSRFTGWSAEAMAVLGDSLHFATGVDVFEGDQTGQDNGSAFVAKACFAHQTFGSPVAKTAKMVRGNFLSGVSFTPKWSIAVDFEANFPTAPNAAAITAVDEGIWDLAEWDVAAWAGYGRELSKVSNWRVVTGHGFSLAAQLQITSGSSTKLDCKLVSYDMTFIGGDT